MEGVKFVAPRFHVTTSFIVSLNIFCTLLFVHSLCGYVFVLYYGRSPNKTKREFTISKVVHTELKIENYWTNFEAFQNESTT